MGGVKRVGIIVSLFKKRAKSRLKEFKENKGICLLTTEVAFLPEWYR